MPSYRAAILAATVVPQVLALPSWLVKHDVESISDAENPQDAGVRNSNKIGAPVEPFFLTRFDEHIQARQDVALSENDIAASQVAMHIPIATVCGPGITGELSLPLPSMSLPVAARDVMTPAVVSASAVMPDGGMTTFASRAFAKRQDDQDASVMTQDQRAVGGRMDIGQLIVGSDGCQTLFAPAQSAVCTTVLSPIGIPPITITACDQYVTFSSETLRSCAPTPEVSPLPAPPPPDNRLANGADSWTTRPFPSNTTDSNSTTSASTPGTGTTTLSENLEDFPTIIPVPESAIEELVERAVMSVSAAQDMPMSLPRQMQAEYHAEGHIRRQIAFRKDRRPAKTDLVTVAPPVASVTFDAPPIFPTTLVNASASNTDAPEFTATKVMPVPEALRAKQKREAVVHARNARSSVKFGKVFNITTGEEIDSDTYGVLKRGEGAKASVMFNATYDPATGKLKATNVLGDLKRRIAEGEDGSSMINQPVNATVSAANATNTTSGLTNSRLGQSPFGNSINLNQTLNGTNSTKPVRASLSPIGAMRFVNVADAALLSPPSPTKYYAAPWQEIAKGGVPTNVKGITCYGGLPPAGECTTPDTDGDTESCECSVVDEVWSVSTVTRTRVGKMVASFDGPAVMTYGALTMTRLMSFTSTITTTKIDTSATVVHSTVTVIPPATDDVKVQITMTSSPSATLSVLPVETGAVDAQMQVKVNAAGMPESGAKSLTPTDSASILPLTESGTSEDFVTSITTVPEVGADDLPTTVLQTSTVTTITVTVPPTDVPAVRARDEGWPTDVWAAELPSDLPAVVFEDQEEFLPVMGSTVSEE